MKLKYFLFILLLVSCLATNSYLPLKATLKKYKTAAAWVFDSKNSELFENATPFPKFYDLTNRIFLKQAGAHSLKFSSEVVSGVTVPYVDFTQTDNAQKASILFSRAEGLEVPDSFTLISIYSKVDENGFRNGGYLAGKWEECDRSREYALFGKLDDFGTNCITGQTSNTGFASPSDCSYAWEGVCSSQIPAGDSLWHTTAMIWSANPAGEASKEHETKCDTNLPSYECEAKSALNFLETPKRLGRKQKKSLSECSYVQVFLDGVPGKKMYYTYKQVYQGTDVYVDSKGQKTNIKRRPLFTVGGTAAKHWRQPDHPQNGKLVGDFTLFGKEFSGVSKNVPVDSNYDWTNDFIQNSSHGFEENDFFVRSRFGGKIAAVFLINQALKQEELADFSVANVFKQ